MKSFLIILLASCVSLSETASNLPPDLTSTTPVDKLIPWTLSWGETLLPKAKKILKAKTKSEKKEAQNLLEHILQDTLIPPTVLTRAIILYIACDPEKPEEIFQKLLKGPAHFQKQAWLLAASLPPSPKMAEAIERAIALTLKGDPEDLLTLWHQPVPEAISHQNISSLYDFLHLGLMEDQNPAYVNAMIQSHPEKASRDFLDYLALGTPEELRQLHMESVNVYSCLEILNFYRSYPIPWGHHHSQHFFLYTVSRNHALAELAREILEKEFALHGNQLVMRILQQPTWVQIALIESLRRHMTPSKGALLKKMSELTGDTTIQQEISNATLL